MLSVLIPTYNYNTVALALEIEKQCTAIGIVFEVIVLDDASNKLHFIEINKKINQIPFCRFERNETNLGRAKNLNKLIKKAIYEWVLILDCDVKPVKNNFIKNYLNSISQGCTIIFGGIAYKDEKPEEEKLLRWIYGRKREEISLKNRIKNPFRTTLTSNILIHKSIFDTIKFNEKITKYGYEDLVFTEELKKNNLVVHHLDNPCYHLNYETSEVFFSKTKIALENLVNLENKGIIKDNVTNLQLTYLRLKKFYLTLPYLFIFKIVSRLLILNLKSKTPILFFMDLLKIGIYTRFKNYKE